MSLLADPSPPSPPQQGERRRRRPVAIRGHAVLADLRLVEIIIDDLSFDGCGLRTPAPLVPGDTIRLSLAERGLIEAHVRSYADGRAGIVFDPESDDEPAGGQRERQSERVALSADVTLRRRGKAVGAEAKVFDASTHGCQLQIAERPEIGERVRIRLEGLQPLDARVCWIEGERAGVEFGSPIHPAVFDLLVARARARARAARAQAQ